MSDTEQKDPLLNDIEMALVLHGLSATKFGWRCCEDPSLVTKLRDGRRIKKVALREKIQQSLRRLEANGEI